MVDGAGLEFPLRPYEDRGGKLLQVKSGTESISTLSKQAFGSWTVTMNHGTDSSSLNSVMRFYFMATDGAFGPGSSTARGYYLFSNSLQAPDLVRLIRDDGGTVSVLASTQITVGTAERTFKITRYENGHFHVFMGSTRILEATDTTYTTAKFMGFLNTADSSSSSVFISSVSASELIGPTLFDDFGDERFDLNPSWTPFAGTWQVNPSGRYLEATSSGTATLSTPAESGEGTWTVRFQSETSSTTTNGILRFYPFFGGSADPGASTVSGYYVFVNTASSQLKLIRQQGTTFTERIVSSWTPDLNFHELKLFRNGDGYWQLYLDGAFKGDATDNTIPFSSGMRTGFRNQADTTGANMHVDDIKIPKGLTQHGAAYLLLSGETLNNRNAGSADVIRFGDRNNDHFGLAVSSSNVADLLIGSPDADFCCQQADSGSAEFIRGSSLEKVAYFTNFDGVEFGVKQGGAWGPPPNTEWELGRPVTSAEVPDNPSGDHTTGTGNAWGTDLDGVYNTVFGDQDLFSPTFDFSDYSSVRLVMWTTYWVEKDFDFIRIAGTKDGGITFTELYSATDHSPQEPPLTGQITWVRLVVGLDAYANTPNVQLRFRLDQDSSVVANGWYIDDVSIAGRSPATLQTIAFPGIAGERSGASVSQGEVTGGAVEDLIIGSPAWSTSKGRIRIHAGEAGPNPASVATTIEGEIAGDEFGASVAGVRDANLGGQGDFLVGAPGRDSGAGRAYLFAGGTILPTNPNAALLTLDFGGAQRGGTSVAGPDANKDLLAELAAGGPGPSVAGGP
ncbi:MAG TPA: hypothetical protein VI893_02645, partial [Thermoplasmata archaeon]|nr:hypothetical protein [Thermoplasmata archaeon]